MFQYFPQTCLHFALNILISLFFCLYKCTVAALALPPVFAVTDVKLAKWGWSGGAMVLGKRPVPGRPKIWMIVGQGPIVLAVSACGGCLTFLLSTILSLVFSLCLRDGPI